MEYHQTKLLVVVNATEWRNLCARGSIRLLQQRPVPVSNPPTENEMAKAFSAAPMTKIDSSVDLLVLEIRTDWPNGARRHPSNQDVAIIDLADVISHHVVSEDNLGYYRTQGGPCAVAISDETYEDAWVTWTTGEITSAAVEAAAALQTALSIELSINQQRDDHYMWSDIARLVIRPSTVIVSKPSCLDQLIKAAAEIGDAAAAARDTEKFFIACAIEWIDHRLGLDPYESQNADSVIRPALLAAGEHSWENPSGLISSPSKAALDYLATSYPEAFTDELPPIAVGLIVRLMLEARICMLSPATVLTILSTARKASESSGQLMCVLVAAAIGPELALQIIRSSREVEQHEKVIDQIAAAQQEELKQEITGVQTEAERVAEEARELAGEVPF